MCPCRWNTCKNRCFFTGQVIPDSFKKTTGNGEVPTHHVGNVNHVLEHPYISGSNILIFGQEKYAYSRTKINRRCKHTTKNGDNVDKQVTQE